MNPEQLTLHEAAREIRSGKLSPVELVDALLARVDKADQRIQAWITLNREPALSEARKCEKEAREKKFRGPLHGIPVGIKDIFYTQGLRTTAGSKIFQNFIPERDARAVQKLKESGAIILGKTVTTEFATFDPGPTRNPWNTSHTPGGSSSGSAAAVAGRMCPAAIGTQTVGSTGRPAAFCGIVGLLPTASRISREGIFPVSWALDHVGAFGRTVKDVELMLDAMSEIPIEKRATPARPRFGVIREFFYQKLAPEAQPLFDGLVTRLSRAGTSIDEVRLPSIFEMVTPVLMTIMRTEIAAAHEGLHRESGERYGPRLRSFVETGMLIDSIPYLRALRIRRKYQEEMNRLFARFDILLTPGAPGPAPPGIQSTGDPVLNAPWTLADFPTLTLPHALASNGLPVAIQLTAPPLDEGRVLQVGQWCEQLIDFHEEPRIV